MIVRKIFESGSDFSVDEMLKGLNLKRDDFESILSKLQDYISNLPPDARELISDLAEEKSEKWENLRAWKVRSILNRYSAHKRTIEEVDTIRDYVIEMEDEGWEVKVDIRNKTMTFKCSDHPISKLNKLFHFLTHTHRFGFRLNNLQKTGTFTAVIVEYRPRVKTVSDIDDINIE